MALIFLLATPDRALRFSITSPVNRRGASSNLARGTKIDPIVKQIAERLTPLKYSGACVAAQISRCLVVSVPGKEFVTPS